MGREHILPTSPIVKRKVAGRGVLREVQVVQNTNVKVYMVGVCRHLYSVPLRLIHPESLIPIE